YPLGYLDRFLGPRLPLTGDRSRTSREVVNGRFTQFDASTLIVRFPELDDLDVALARLHKEGEVQGVRLVATGAPGCRACTRLDEVDQLEIHQLLDRLVHVRMVSDLVQRNEERGLPLLGEAESHEVHEQRLERRNLAPRVGSEVP